MSFLKEIKRKEVVEVVSVVVVEKKMMERNVEFNSPIKEAIIDIKVDK